MTILLALSLVALLVPIKRVPTIISIKRALQDVGYSSSVVYTTTGNTNAVYKKAKNSDVIYSTYNGQAVMYSR